MIKYKFLLFLLLSFLEIKAQYFTDTIFSRIIGNVKFFQENNQLSYPVIELNSGQALELRFDLFSDIPINLQYSFVHCSWDWTEEDLLEHDFLDGYYYNPIYDYRQSFNTNVTYYNYKIKIPNKDVNFLVSGNYLIKISLTSDPDSVLLQKRFIIVEKKFNLDSRVKPATNSALRLTHQEIDVSLDIAGNDLYDPYANLRLAIYQNFRADRIAFLYEPKFFQGSNFIYDYDEINVFPGGNEFRTFSIVDYKFHSGKVFRSEFQDSLYHSFLLPDYVQVAHASYNDANGNFIIRARNVNDVWSESDYVMVNFFLLAKKKIPFSGNVYVFGSLSNWKIKPEFKLVYNEQANGYIGQVLLKQGIYDYKYILVKNGKPDFSAIEGNFYHTENDYLIFVYYQEQAPYYWRVMAYQKIKYP